MADPPDTREEPTVAWTLEVVILPVSDIDASIAFYRDKVGFELKVRAEKPLIPVDYRGRFGA